MSADYSFAIRKGQRTGFRRRHRSFSHGARGLVDVVFGAQNALWVTEMIEANGPHYYQKPLKKLIFSAQDTENSIPNQLARSAKEGPRQILSWFPTSLNQTGRKPSLRFGVALIASRKHWKKLIFSAQDTENLRPKAGRKSAKEGRCAGFSKPKQILS